MEEKDFLNVEIRMIQKFGYGVALMYAALQKRRKEVYPGDEYLDTSIWFSLSLEEVEHETGLSYYKQEKACKVLCDNDYIDCKIKGMPARRSFVIF